MTDLSNSNMMTILILFVLLSLAKAQDDDEISYPCSGKAGKGGYGGKGGKTSKCGKGGKGNKSGKGGKGQKLDVS